METGETHAVGRLGIYKAGRWAGAVGSWNHVKRGSQEVAATSRACCCCSGVRPENLTTGLCNTDVVRVGRKLDHSPVSEVVGR